MSRFALPSNVAPGDPIRAEHFNALLEALRRMTAVRGSGGISVINSGQGLMIQPGAKARRQRIYLSRISEVLTGGSTYTPAVPEVGQTPSDITYKVTVVERPQMEELTGTAGGGGSGLTPTYGRPTRNDESLIYPAKVNALCFMHEWWDDTTRHFDLWIPIGGDGEVLAFETCAT